VNTPEEEAPFGFATRVVARWKEAAKDGHGLDVRVQMLWFRRTLMCALAVMAISVGWSFTSYTNDAASSGDEVAIASYDASADLP
jgi:hypothetical protein